MNKIQTILITGATDGIGKRAAMDLATKYNDATVIIHGRDKTKVDKTIAEIKYNSTNTKIEGIVADFTSLQEVKQMANEVLSRYDRINILINNAGVGTAPPRYGKEGTEARFTVNYLAPVVLTTQLLPALKRATPAHIVNVSSAGQSAIHFDDIMLERRFDASTAYTQSKLALVMFTFDLADQVRKDNIAVNTLHPGTYLDTNMVREAGVSPLGTAQSGADAVVYLATSDEVKNITGRYFNVKKEANAHAQAYDPEARKKLQDITRKLTGIG